MRYVVFGKIGSGKSSIAQEMAKTLHLPYYNVDQWVAQWYETYHAKEWLHKNMGISTKQDAMLYLKSHPDMWEPLIEQTELFVHDCFDSIIDETPSLVLEFPLLTQYPRYKQYFDYAVWVHAPYEIRYQRVMNRDGMDPERFRILDGRQGVDAEYDALSDWNIINDGSWDLSDWVENLHTKKELLLHY